MTESDSRSREFPYLILEARANDVDLLLSALWECGSGGVEELASEAPEGSSRFKAYFDDAGEIEACRRLVESGFPTVAVLESGFVRIDDWISLLHGGFEPVAVGPLLIVPAGPPAPPVQVPKVVRIKPGLGFGTGTHPTTRLCLEFLCERVRSGNEVLDVGAGSGILAIAAASLGAGKVHAVDTDADALSNARENVALNGLADRIQLEVGSLETAGKREFHIVVANIGKTTLQQLLSTGLADAVLPGGYLILSGFAPPDAQILIRALKTYGLEKKEQRDRGNWSALLAEKSDAIAD